MYDYLSSKYIVEYSIFWAFDHRSLLSFCGWAYTAEAQKTDPNKLILMP